MNTRLAAVVLALGLCVATVPMSGQRLGPAHVYAVPASPTTLGESVRLAVRPPASGTTYRYIAAMSVTGSGMMATGTPCATTQTIGTGPVITWKPASGAYRLTLLAVRHLQQPESTFVNYQVDPPNGGFLTVTVMQNPTPQPPGKLMLSLRTNDRGAGSRYQWVVRFVTSAGTPVHPPVYWTGDTPYHMHTVPFVVQPGTYNINVRVGIHSGDPCRVTETSLGMLTAQVIH